MALHMVRSAPSFTISLRGYDKDEVDDYVDSLRQDRDADAEALEEANEAISRLERNVAKLGERANDLESCLRVETPRSIFALGQRLTLILEQAEDAASETVSQAAAEAERLLVEAEESAEATLRSAAVEASEAEGKAAALIYSAEQRAASVNRAADERATSVTEAAEAHANSVTQAAEAHANSVTQAADERATSVTQAADERSASVIQAAALAARRSEENTRQQVESMLCDAEARASARAQEMEAWARRMHAHLNRERNEASEEFARTWKQRQDDLDGLASQRAEVIATLDAMRSGLQQTVTDALGVAHLPLGHAHLPEGALRELEPPASLEPPELFEPQAVQELAVVQELPAPEDAGDPERAVYAGLRATGSYASLPSAGVYAGLPGPREETPIVDAGAEASPPWAGWSDPDPSLSAEEPTGELKITADTAAEHTAAEHTAAEHPAADAVVAAGGGPDGELDSWAASWKLPDRS